MGSGSSAASPLVASRSLSPRSHGGRAFVLATLIFSSLAASPAFADSLQILGPSGLVAPDGFSVTLVRRDAKLAPLPLSRPALKAEGGEVRPGAPQGPLRVFEIVPLPGVRQVTLRAEDAGLSATAAFEVGPPAARVQLALDPATPVKGRDKEATLTVKLRRADGTPDLHSSPPVLRANVGRIEGLARVGAGEYRARYVLPETRYPEVAILVAFSAWPHPDSIHGAVGRILVPLATAIELPGRTEPSAQMSLEIAGNRYGPVTSDAKGRFRIPVVVPPGHRFAQGLAVDRAGNRRRTRIDLMLPPTDQLACVMNPTRLPADGVSDARVLCAASDPYGKPVGSKGISLSAPKGRLSAPRATEQGMIEWVYTAPRELGATDTLVATWRQGRQVSREELSLQLVQGPVVKVQLSASDGLVHRGGSVELSTKTFDAAGRPRPGVPPRFESTVGAFGPVHAAGNGGWETELSVPPESDAPKAEVRVTAVGPAGQVPARLEVWKDGGVLVAGVFDLASWPVPDQVLRVGAREHRTGADGTAVIGTLEGTADISHAEWPGLRRTVHAVGPWLTPLDAPRRPPTAEVSLLVGPPVPVNVRLQIRGREVSYWVEDSRGRVLAGRPVLIALSSGERIDAVTRPERSTVRVRPEGAGISVADVATGVTAFAEVKP